MSLSYSSFSSYYCLSIFFLLLCLSYRSRISLISMMSWFFSDFSTAYDSLSASISC